MPPQEQVSITFGHPEFWPEVAKTFPEFFPRAGRIQQAVVSVTDRAYEALDSNQHILLNILMLEAVGMVEALTLIGNGMGHGAMKIVRGMVENAINAEYIRRFPEQGERYTEWHWMEIHKLYKYIMETSPEALKEVPPEKVAEDLANYERVKGLFRYTVKGKDGIERIIKQDSWSDADQLDARLKEQGITLIAPHRPIRRRKTQDHRPLRRYRRRWKMERLFAWLHSFRRLVTRWEYHATNFLGMVQLGCMLILLRRL
jgi:hypothetical protein